MNVMTRPVSSTPDLDAVKQRQQAAWSSGNYAVVGTTLQIVGERLAAFWVSRDGIRPLSRAV
ncbi:MAG: hypothetical protein J7507_09240, partial [Pseudoxanthomonas sp.]|nr:hypothetical protein [Pseudoxanthomonas sp.]